MEAGYGIELDLHLTTDGRLVVFHDDTLDRVCGVTGRVDEKSYAELQQLRLLGVVLIGVHRADDAVAVYHRGSAPA